MALGCDLEVMGFNFRLVGWDLGGVVGWFNFGHWLVVVVLELWW